MLSSIIRVNREGYVCEGGLTPHYFQAKVFSIVEASEWIAKRLGSYPKLFKHNSLKDTDIELMLVED